MYRCEDKILFEKKTITVFIILFTFICSYAQNVKVEKGSQFIDVSEFFNSAHHWYDIYADDNVIEPKPNQPRYKPIEITGIADNILLYQKDNGGWPKNYDMLAILTESQKDSLIKSKNILNTTFDNWTTNPQVEYLAHAYTITKNEKYREACINGIEFILSAQYPNGGWPQFWPDTSGYKKYITFNDGVVTGTMTILKNIMDKKANYEFVDEQLREKVKSAYDKGLNCILECQVISKGRLTAWGQQHDNVTLKPQWARAFEPPGICNGESVGVVLFLMSIENPNSELINSIQNAVKWFEDSKILGIRIEERQVTPVKYRWSTIRIDRVVIEDSSAPPIWTRYYEQETDRPLFCNRDSKVVYSLAEVLHERRGGYSWYTYDPQEVLDKYPEWQKKWAPDKNVLLK